MIKTVIAYTVIRNQEEEEEIKVEAIVDIMVNDALVNLKTSQW